MPKPVTDDERRRILDHLATGASCNATAKKFHRSPDTISRIAKKAGHSFGHTNLARAHEARKSYGAEQRASTAARMHEEADRLLDQLHRPHLVWSFGGRDNEYNERLHDEPDVAAKYTMIRAAREAMRTVLDIDRHDNRQGDVDQAAGLIVDLVDGIRQRRE
jgi:IS30 family transposase